VNGVGAQHSCSGNRAMLESDDRSTRAAPPPDATTFNTVLGSVLEAKEPYTWLLRDAASVGITPDARTLALMLKNQPDLAATNRVWALARRRALPRSKAVWHHLIEAHLRNKRAGRAAALLGLMERDGYACDDTLSHNLHLRGLVGSGQGVRGEIALHIGNS